jgi:hypothetical protein
MAQVSPSDKTQSENDYKPRASPPESVSIVPNAQHNKCRAGDGQHWYDHPRVIELERAKG